MRKRRFASCAVDPVSSSAHSHAMQPVLSVADRFAIPLDEIALSFIRSGGPGGQNVNKVATAVQLRFDLLGSSALPDAVKQRAARLAGSRLTGDGVIVITASSFRTRAQNREDALARLAQLLAQAAQPPKRRVPTRPTLASKRRRVEAKKSRSGIKTLRGRVDPTQ